jgi:putative transposase
VKKSRFTDAQVFEILKESESGVKTAELVRKHGISANTFYHWRAKYGGMSMSDLKRMKALEAENSELKRLVAEQALENRALKAINAKKF